MHCVIVGFGLSEPQQRVLFDYGDDIKGEPTAITAHNINPYLVDAPTVFLDKRRTPICAAPEMDTGSYAVDGGNLLMSDTEKEALLQAASAKPKRKKNAAA